MQSNGQSGPRSMHLSDYESDMPKQVAVPSKRTRPFTLDEALPYSPLSSVVPFNSGIVPIPSIGLRASSCKLSDSVDLTEVRDELDSLDQNVLAGTTSQKLERTLQELQRLLHPKRLTKCKFKVDSRVSMFNHSVEDAQRKMSLSPFARLVFDNTDVAYAPLTPESLASPSQHNGHRMIESQDVEHSAKLQSIVSPRVAHTERNDNVRAFHKNNRIEVQIPVKERAVPHKQVKRDEFTPTSHVAVVLPAAAQTIVPKQVRSDVVTLGSQVAVVLPAASGPVSHERINLDVKPSSSDVFTSGSQLAVVLPAAAERINKSEYIAMADIDDAIHQAPSRNLQKDVNNHDDVFLSSTGLREKADQASKALATSLEEILEAHDTLQSTGTDSTGTFSSVADEQRLASTTQIKFESLIHKAVKVGCLSAVSPDDLLRVQRLCDGAVRCLDATQTSILSDSKWQEGDEETRLAQLSAVENSLRAGRTALRLMTGSLEERQLYSETTIQSVIDGLSNVVQNIIIPIVELRSSGAAASIFKQFSAHKKAFISITVQCRQVFSLLNTLNGQIDLSDTVINSLEYLSSTLIFVDNAHTEKDSVLGVQKFDPLRVVAMDTLAQIFLVYPGQRAGIFDEILTSLSKLPVTKQSARHFKLADGGSVQLVSALIMRLIQTSVNDVDNEKEKRKHKASDLVAIKIDDRRAAEDTYMTTTRPITANGLDDHEYRAGQNPMTTFQRLEAKVTPLLESAKQNAQYVIAYIVKQAITKKTGEAPYRDLLDLFIQDFITCLNSPDWPAAELLLRLFVYKMVGLVETDKTAALAKNMALDLLGEMGAAISDINSHVRKSANGLETSEDAESRFTKQLLPLAEDSLEGRVNVGDLLSWQGPYRMTLSRLRTRVSEEHAVRSALAFLVADWASQVTEALDKSSSEASQVQLDDAEAGRLAHQLHMMLSNERWIHAEPDNNYSAKQSRLAYYLVVVNSKFCKTFERVLMILLQSMSSDQAMVRNKSLKSVNHVLETDPTILDRGTTVMRLITGCLSDPSVQVRESALGLIGNCINLRPKLEENVLPDILLRVNDSGIGVRKRAIKLLRDIYLRNQRVDVRTSIAEALLHRATDLDEGVQELARQTIEEVWVRPFYLPVSQQDLSIQYRLDVTSHVRLMTQTIRRNTGVSVVLEKILRNLLAKESKNAAANLKVCKILVTAMFESVVESNGHVDTRLEDRDCLQLLMLFAKTDSSLFSVEQVQQLQPYIQHLQTDEDLAVFRAVVVIFRHAFPLLSSAHTSFLVAIRTTLMGCVSKLAKSLMDDVVACLWIISEAVGSKEHLARLAASALKGVQGSKDLKLGDINNENAIRKFSKLATIVGLVGKHCDLDSETDAFRKLFPAWKESSVAKLMVDITIPFASDSYNLEVRKTALDAVGLVCQSWPKNFSSVKVSTTFGFVFNDGTKVLETVILKAFNEFLILEEKRSEPETEAVVGSGLDAPATLGVMGGTHHDGVALELAHKFLKDITRIAMATQDEHALLATQILTSINRQGMNHPKECGPALVALETSQNSQIADLAYREHKSLHQKHETIMEKEYMRAVHAAFEYQRSIVQDVRGAIRETSTSKLHLLLDVLKISKPLRRKRFFENLCSRIDFEPAKLDVGHDVPAHLLFSQFLIENLAFFDYAAMDDLLVAVEAMEKLATGIGSNLAHVIETEVFRLGMPEVKDGDNAELPPTEIAVDTLRLRQLTTSSMILSSLWEARTFLRKLYGFTQKREQKSKGINKDLSKAPVKTQGVSSEKVWMEFDRILGSLATKETMMQQCKAFIELMTVDKDVKIAAEDDEESATRARFTTPSDGEDADQSTLVGSGRGRKRKMPATPGGRKKRARSSSVIGNRPKINKSGSGSEGSDSAKVV